MKKTKRIKLTIEVNEKDLPGSFQGQDGLENLVRFLHDQIVCEPLEQKFTDEVYSESRKAFFNAQKMNGQACVDEIRRVNNEKAALGQILLDNLVIGE